MDRVIQQAIAQVLEPIWEPQLADRSYGFRPGRLAHGAIRRLRDDLKSGRRVAVDLDLAKFFDRVNHDVLMHRLSRCVEDKTLLKLIGRYLRAGVCVDGRVEPTREGVPQGGPLSPLLANPALAGLDDLDKELEKRGHRFVRYADDFIVLVKSPRAGGWVKASLQKFLSQKLKLQINEVKSRVAPVEQCTFLGFTLKGKSIRWAERSLEKFKRRIRQLTGRSWGVSMRYRLKELTVYVRGWMNYFGIVEDYTPIPEGSRAKRQAPLFPNGHTVGSRVAASRNA